MALPLILATHALAALLHAALALWTLRTRRADLPRRALAAALAATALWSLAVAGLGSEAAATRGLEALRNLAWLWLVFAVRRDPRIGGVPAGFWFGGIGALFALAGMAATLVTTPAALLAAMATIAALLLVHDGYQQARTAIARRLSLIVAAIWIVDVNLSMLAWARNPWPAELVLVRGVILVALACAIGAVVQREDRRPVQLSRKVTVQSLSLAAILAYFALLGVTTDAIGRWGGGNAQIAQTAFVFGLTAAALALLSTPRLRAWIKVKLAKHLFRHRYDYRAEWMRFTDTLGKPEDTLPLDARVVKAIADLTDSPAGVLLVPDGGGLGLGAAWRWEAAELPATIASPALVAHLAAAPRIIELDALRGSAPDPADLSAVPQWMLDMAQAWAVVPLPHLGTLAGAILLARPPVDRRLDWEDFDLLKVAGRQVASYLAESRAHARLAEVERFDEFNRRFAFILHDIKNLVSQLSLVARNAERHADNPAFRADMVATLQESAGRMTDLVHRLSQSPPRTDPPRPVPLLPLAEAIAAARRLVHPVVVAGDAGAVAFADAGRIEQILHHLVQNAIEASTATDPVRIAVEAAGAHVAVEVIDAGTGMSPAFVRERLFRPFASTKPGGFGIGAYEARQHALAMGGSLDVASREGEGTRFRLTLPAAHAMEAAA